MVDQSQIDTPPLTDDHRRLIFRAWHRGTREMDLLIGSFADAHVPGMDADDLAEFTDILMEPDPDLYDWISGRTTPPETRRGKIFDRLLTHCFAKRA